jgi:hypothetical protein
MDISHHVEALSSLTDHSEPPLQTTASPVSETPAALSSPHDLPKQPIPPAQWKQIERMKGDGNSIYLLKISLPENPMEAEQTAEHVLEEARSYGTVLSHQVDGDASPNTLTLLFACVLESEDVASLFEIDPGLIHEISEEGRLSVATQNGQTAEPFIDDHIEGSTPADPEQNASPSVPGSAGEPIPEVPDPQGEIGPAQPSAPVSETTLRVRVGCWIPS